MIQIVGWLGCFYLVVKGVEVLQIGLASTRENRAGLIGLGWLTLAACVVGAIVFAGLLDEQAGLMPSSLPTPP